MVDDNLFNKPWNFNMNRITCKKIPLLTSIEFGMALKQSLTHFKEKQKYFSLPDHKYAEN